MAAAMIREESGHHILPFERIVAFTKMEKILKAIAFDPRLIQGRNERYTAVVGPTLWTAGKILASVWGPEDLDCVYSADDGHKCKQLFYATGLAAEDYGAWYDGAMQDLTEHFPEEDIVVMENDFSRFDSTIGVELLGIERSVYQWMFHMPPKISRALQSQDRTEGYTKHGVHYRRTGGRHSGDANTSVGNTILNAGAALWIASEALGCHPKDVPMRGIFGGDDSYILMPRAVAEIVYAAAPGRFRALGLRPKTKLVSRWMGEFYSAVFVPTAEGTVLLPKPGRVLAKSFYAKKPYAGNKARGWAKAVAEDRLMDVGTFPWVRILLKHVTAQTAEVQRYHDRSELSRQQYKKHARRSHKPNPDTWDFIWRRYKITPPEFKEFERWFELQALQLGETFFVAHDLLRKVHVVDVGPLED
jgi:hypothetical protein